MKTNRIIAIALVFGGVCSASFAQIEFSLTAPRDDGLARSSVQSRAELKPLQTAYSEIIKTRLDPLSLDGVATIFGPAIKTSTNLFSYPQREKYPADMVLPVFGHGNWGDDSLRMGIPGVLSQKPDHADLHQVGSIGYIQFFYKGFRPTVADAAIYFRADEKFTPLGSTNDFAKRLAWDKAKLEALGKWLDDHRPKVTDLGVVNVSAAGPKQVDLGGGTACLLKIMHIRNPIVTNSLYTVFLTKEDRDRPVEPPFDQFKAFDRTNESWEFSIDGKFYRLTPRLVE